MLRSSRSLVLGLAVWLAVVLVGSVLVWTVISRAGADVTAGSTSAPPDATGALGPATSPTPAAGTRTRRPGDRPARPPRGASASAGPTDPGSATPGAPTSPSAAEGSTATPGAPTPRPSSSPTPAPTPRPAQPTPRPSPAPTSAPSSQGTGPSATVQRRTWSGAAGVVTAECRASAISLVGASASADGYVVEVNDRGPEKLEVHFEGRGGEDGNETEVRAECRGGIPTFSVKTDSD